VSVSVFQAQLLVGDGYAVVSISGELDMGTVPILRSALEQVSTGERSLVVIDAAGLDFIDSSGLGVCIGAHKTLSAHGVRLLIANLPSRLYRPLRITGLAKVIPTHVTDEPTAPWTGRASPDDIYQALGFTTGVPRARPPVANDVSNPR
jgi:anti-sigma B factor antagonist